MASKYERLPSLLLAYLWNVDRPRDLEAFCMTCREAFTIAEAMAWTATASWKAGLYRMSPPSAKLRGLLERHRMAPGRWRAKVLEPVARTGKHTSSDVFGARTWRQRDIEWKAIAMAPRKNKPKIKQPIKRNPRLMPSLV